VALTEGDDLQFTVQVAQLDDVDANRYSEVFVSFRLLLSSEVFRTGTHKGAVPLGPAARCALAAAASAHRISRVEPYPLASAQNGPTSSTTSSP